MSVSRVRPSGSFLDQSRRRGGFIEVWRHPRLVSRALVAVVARCWRRRMSARASRKERRGVVLAEGLMTGCGLGFGIEAGECAGRWGKRKGRELNAHSSQALESPSGIDAKPRPIGA